MTKAIKATKAAKTKKTKAPLSETIPGDLASAPKEELAKIQERVSNAVLQRSNEEKQARKDVEEQEKTEKELKVQQRLLDNRTAAEEKDKKEKPTGEQHKPLPWLPPYPASKMEEKEETVFVRATVLQDIIMNGDIKKIGQHTLPAGFAHANAAALAAPKL